MEGLTSIERACVERAMAEPMLRQVRNWAEVNSGSRNLEGLGIIAARLAGAFADLPGEPDLLEPDRVEAIDESGRPYDIPHGRNLHHQVRPDAPVQREGGYVVPLHRSRRLHWNLALRPGAFAATAQVQ